LAYYLVSFEFGLAQSNLLVGPHACQLHSFKVKFIELFQNALVFKQQRCSVNRCAET
jgi:hypothetical protein